MQVFTDETTKVPVDLVNPPTSTTKKSNKMYKWFGVFALTLALFFTVNAFRGAQDQSPLHRLEFEQELPSQASMVLAADGSAYTNVWSALASRSYRFILFKRDITDPSNYNRLLVQGGPWDWTFSQFWNAFDSEANQVGFFYAGPVNQEGLTMVVYTPASLGKTSNQVLESYELPTDPKAFQKFGLNIVKVLVVKNRNDITYEKLNDFPKTAAPAPTASTSAPDGSVYIKLWQDFKSKTSRFYVFGRDPADPRKISVQAAPWNALFFDFTNTFQENKEQVGFYLMSSSAGDQLYQVVYAPTSAGLSAAQVVTNFGLPTDPAVLQQKFQLPVANTLVVREKKDITLTNVVMNARSGGIISLISLDGSDDFNDLINGEDLKQVALPASFSVLADGSLYPHVWDALRSKNYRFIIFKRDWNNPEDSSRLKIEGGPWTWTFDQFLNSLEPHGNQVAFIYVGPEGREQLCMVVLAPVSLGKTSKEVLDDYQLPTNPSDLQEFRLPVAKVLMASEKKQITLERFGGDPQSDSATTNSPAATTGSNIADGAIYSTLWQAFLNKGNRFFIFSRDPVDHRKVNVKPGAWNALFFDFVNGFENNKEQVGFYLMSSQSGDQLYEVIYAPASAGASPAAVLTNFGLPSDPAVLRKYGLPLPNVLVVREKKEIDLTNVIMNAKSGAIVSL